MTDKSEQPTESQETKVTFSLEALSRALDLIISDPETQKRLEQKPLETLAELGIEFDPATHERLSGKTLVEVLAEEYDMELAEGQIQLVAMPLVFVFVRVVTNGTRPATRTRAGSVVKSATNVTANSIVTAKTILGR